MYVSACRLILTRVDLLYYVCKITWLRMPYILQSMLCYHDQKVEVHGSRKGKRNGIIEAKWNEMNDKPRTRCETCTKQVVKHYYYIYNQFPYILVYKMITFISKSSFVSILYCDVRYPISIFAKKSTIPNCNEICGKSHTILIENTMNSCAQI